MKLVTITALRYASRDLAAGEEFEASESDAFVLKKTGKAMDAARAKQSAASSDGDALFSGDQESGKRSGRYNRRDMRAKD